MLWVELEVSGFRAQGSCRSALTLALGVLDFGQPGAWVLTAASGSRVLGLGFRVQGLGSRVSGLGFRGCGY